jgi:YHS domain-containing protein
MVSLSGPVSKRRCLTTQPSGDIPALGSRAFPTVLLFVSGRRVGCFLPRTPAGKIRGGTQEEIALLALAEVVTARRKRGHVPTPVEASHVVFATDQVCGMTVDPLTAQHKFTYRDTTYWFCSAGCSDAFEKEPERYLRTIEA